MPDFDSWVTLGIDWRCAQESGSFAFTQMQQEYEEYRRECLHQDTMYEQQMQMHEQQYEQQMEEERQLIKDKEKYPLFFLKEGIV